MRNKDGQFVAPDDTAFKAAAAGADWNKTFYQITTEQPGKDSWPITGATYILMYKSQDKPASAAATLKFFDWAYANGDKMADRPRLRAAARQRQEPGPQAVGRQPEGRRRQGDRLQVTHIR